MITKLRRQMIFMVMGVVTVLLMAIFLILYHSAVSGFETRSVEALREALQQEQPQGHGAGDSTAPPENKPDEVTMEPKPGTLTPPAGREDRPILVLEKRADGTISILKNTFLGNTGYRKSVCIGGSRQQRIWKTSGGASALPERPHRTGRNRAVCFWRYLF